MPADEGRIYGAVTGKIRRLLTAVGENAGTLPDVSVERHTLELALTNAEEAKARQDAAKGEKQLATQELHDALDRGKEAMRQLQSAAKFKLGARSEKLVVFQVVPLRKHGSRLAAQLRRQEKTLEKRDADLVKKEMELLRRRQAAETLRHEVEALRKEVGALEMAS
jgi:uncharacterized protein (DUF3084 family)